MTLSLKLQLSFLAISGTAFLALAIFFFYESNWLAWPTLVVGLLNWVPVLWGIKKFRLLPQ
jgi:hypothetical protein